MKKTEMDKLIKDEKGKEKVVAKKAGTVKKVKTTNKKETETPKKEKKIAKKEEAKPKTKQEKTKKVDNKNAKSEEVEPKKEAKKAKAKASKAKKAEKALEIAEEINSQEEPKKEEPVVEKAPPKPMTIDENERMYYTNTASQIDGMYDKPVRVSAMGRDERTSPLRPNSTVLDGVLINDKVMQQADTNFNLNIPDYDDLDNKNDDFFDRDE